MNPLVQSCSRLPKKYDRDIWVGLLVIPRQTRKGDTLLALFRFNPKAPHITKNKNIKPQPDRYVKDD